MSSADILPSEEELIMEIKEVCPGRKRIRKFVIASIAIFLLLLFVMYFVFGDVWHILEGKIGSYQVDNDYSVQTEYGSIIFSEEVYNKIVFNYFDNQETEVAFCLRGNLKNKEYYLDDFYIPPTKHQEVFSVTAEMCDKDTLVAFNTHPYKSCIFSSADINYYKSFSNLNPDGMIGLMCEPNRFTFYRE